MISDTVGGELYDPLASEATRAALSPAWNEAVKSTAVNAEPIFNVVVTSYTPFAGELVGVADAAVGEAVWLVGAVVGVLDALVG